MAVKFKTPHHYDITPATGICDSDERMFTYNKMWICGSERIRIVITRVFQKPQTQRIIYGRQNLFDSRIY